MNTSGNSRSIQGTGCIRAPVEQRPRRRRARIHAGLEDASDGVVPTDEQRPHLAGPTVLPSCSAAGGCLRASLWSRPRHALRSRRFPRDAPHAHTHRVRRGRAADELFRPGLGDCRRVPGRVGRDRTDRQPLCPRHGGLRGGRPGAAVAPGDRDHDRHGAGAGHGDVQRGNGLQIGFRCVSHRGLGLRRHCRDRPHGVYCCAAASHGRDDDPRIL